MPKSKVWRKPIIAVQSGIYLLAVNDDTRLLSGEARIETKEKFLYESSSKMGLYFNL